MGALHNSTQFSIIWYFFSAPKPTCILMILSATSSLHFFFPPRWVKLIYFNPSSHRCIFLQVLIWCSSHSTARSQNRILLHPQLLPDSHSTHAPRPKSATITLKSSTPVCFHGLITWTVAVSTLTTASHREVHWAAVALAQFSASLLSGIGYCAHLIP